MRLQHNYRARQGADVRARQVLQAVRNETIIGIGDNMGAETEVFVLVLKSHEEWITVQAVTLTEAGVKAAQLPGVISVLEACYEPVMDEPRDQY